MLNIIAKQGKGDLWSVQIDTDSTTVTLKNLNERDATALAGIGKHTEGTAAHRLALTNLFAENTFAQLRETIQKQHKFLFILGVEELDMSAESLRELCKQYVAKL